MEKKKYLFDVVLIRLVLIFFLVFYHAFCPFTGAWDAFDDQFYNIEIYKWLGLLTHNFRLESMVFISGLLFGYTINIYPERLCIKNCVIKKLKRVILPSLIFSVLYYLIFDSDNKDIVNVIINISNGYGHLWFLPMIFWSFVLCFIIEKITPPHSYSISNKSHVFILIICFIMLQNFPFEINYLGLGKLHRYFFYFYLGFCMKRGYINMIIIQKKIWLYVLLMIYLLSCVSYEIIISSWESPEGLFNIVLRSLLIKILHPICVLSMLTFLYSIANRKCVIDKLKSYPILLTLSGYCYGVYIYHQFILKYLYYKTSFSNHFSLELIPWIGFLIALLLSLLCCHITLRTKIGRFLIG